MKNKKNTKESNFYCFPVKHDLLWMLFFCVYFPD